MNKFLVFAFLFFSLTQVSAIELEDKPGEIVRVGVFANPPVAFKTETGDWSGISIDLLKSIADEKSWVLEFKSGSFSDLLKKLDNGEIDLISMMAFSEGRAKKYSFTKNHIISNWGVVYSKNKAHISSVLDLEGKRVAVMNNNIHDKAFRKLIKKFGINCEIVPLENFSDVMQSISLGDVDAGVANRLFGIMNASKYNVLETGIIFNPINIHYSTLLNNNPQIRQAIDSKFDEYKTNKDSVYYSSIRKSLTQTEINNLPRWLVLLAMALVSVIVLMFGVTFLLRKQVALRTKELQQEVDDRRIADCRLDELAYYDSLTKLPNRFSLLENLKVSISSAKLKNIKFAVLFIDIDRFKTVNDSLGHDSGDQLIIHVAQRLQACLRVGDSINRFGGDEFVAILHDIKDEACIEKVTDRMLSCLNMPINVGISELYTSVCIGVSVYPDDDPEGIDLLKFADAAMYHAKDQGGNNFQFYNKALTERVQNRLDLETRLRHALERNEFELAYQPIFNLCDCSVAGVEALIRWRDPERGVIYPDEFIPLSEESGLISSIGEWVLDESCRQLNEWESEGLGKLAVAINVSSQQLENTQLYTKLMSALDKYNIDAQQIEFEITERMFLNISNNVQKSLDLLTNEGVQFAIDDFGTGYSSLSYLKELPINTLKVDRSFVMGIPDDTDDMQITSTIIRMAHDLRLDVVAEGIETEQQLNFLKGLNCGRGQGYHLCKPQAATEITEWLKNRSDVI